MSSVRISVWHNKRVLDYCAVKTQHAYTHKQESCLRFWEIECVLSIISLRGRGPSTNYPHAFSFSPLAFAKVGGYSALLNKYSSATPLNFTSLEPHRYNISPHCYTPRADAFDLLRDPAAGDLPWPGVLIGIPIGGIWYWCTDQVTFISVEALWFGELVLAREFSQFLTASTTIKGEIQQHMLSELQL